MNEAENRNMEIYSGLDFLLNSESDHLKTIQDGNMLFQIRKDGTAGFDWFRNLAEIPEVLEIPNCIDDSPVVRILSPIADEYPSIRQIVLPDSVSDPGKNPFDCCPNLEKIVVPPGHPCLTVENGLLIDRPARRVISCPASLNTETVRVPSWVESIGPDAFSNCVRLHSIILPDGVTEIGECAFSRCVSLETITVPSGVPELKNDTFNECTALKQIVLPEGIRRIGDLCFACCTSLITLRLPDSVESFGCFVFTDCENLEEIHLPAGLREIDINPFVHCKKLERIQLQAGHPNYRIEGSLLIDQSRQQVVCCFYALRKEGCSVPAGIRRIEAFAFDGIDWIREIHLPEELESLGDGAFSECMELRSVHLPHNLETLEDFVFIGCHKLKRMNLPKKLHFFGEFCIPREDYLTLIVERKSAARDYCRRHGLPYRYVK